MLWTPLLLHSKYPQNQISYFLRHAEVFSSGKSSPSESSDNELSQLGLCLTAASRRDAIQHHSTIITDDVILTHDDVAHLVGNRFVESAKFSESLSGESGRTVGKQKLRSISLCCSGNARCFV